MYIEYGVRYLSAAKSQMSYNFIFSRRQEVCTLAHVQLVAPGISGQFVLGQSGGFLGIFGGMRYLNNQEVISKNYLASIFIKESRNIFIADCSFFNFSKNEILYNVDDNIKQIYFPIDMIFSMKCELSNGHSAEFAQIGRDGAVGISALMDGHVIHNTAISQTSGSALSVPVDVVKETFNNSSYLRVSILRYMQALMQEAAQRIVCTRNHSVEEQFCRTLLMSSDRLKSDEINLTHEQLADAIGCRREAVSVAAGKIQVEGWIDHSYGRIKILDRKRLESRSCECYAVIRKAFEDFLR